MRKHLRRSISWASICQVLSKVESKQKDTRDMGYITTHKREHLSASVPLSSLAKHAKLLPVLLLQFHQEEN